ncbi:MAG: ATP-binding protein [Bacteroidota bacterium]
MQNLKSHILIVEDEKGLRLGTQRLLEEEGYAVSVAENGSEGIKLGTSNEFDIAVIDLRMPDIDGLEVLKEIKKVHSNTVCFIATAFASYETAIQATRIGAYGYIPKPFTPEEFIYQIEQGIKQRELILSAERLKKEREENLFELASEKSRLNAIIKSINEGVLVLNKNGDLAYYNYAALKYLNIQEINIGENVIDKLPAKIVEVVKTIFSNDIFLLKTYTVQIEVKPNNELILEAACTPVPHPDGSLAGVVITLGNITEFKKIEVIKSQFVSMVAHEMKTPLAAVQGFLNIIIDDTINVEKEKRKDYLKRSIVRLKSLTDLVNDLLDISRMELKTKHREIENIKVKEILNNVLQTLELEIKKKNIAIQKNVEEKLPVIQADQNDITRIISNLLSNAIKYNKENGSIWIELSSTQNYLILRISDTGIGIKPEERSKLFSEFYRIKNDRTRGISGTGLGLSIVKRIVESYHGKIEVDSQFEVGTTFTINLPINLN